METPEAKTTATSTVVHDAIASSLKGVIHDGEDTPQGTPDPAKLVVVAHAGATDDMILGKKPEPVVVVQKVEPVTLTEADLGQLPEKSRKAFATQRQHIKSLEDRIAAAEKNVHTPPEDMVKLNERLTALQAERDGAFDQLGKVNLQLDPRFNAKYAGKVNTVMATITGYLKDLGVAEPEKVAQDSMGKPLKERIAQLQEVAPDILPALLPLYSEIDRITVERNAELQQHAQVRQNLEQQTNANVEQVQTQAFSTAVSKAQAEGHFLFNRVEGNAEWNKNVDTIEGEVKRVMKADGMTQVQTMALGVAAPVYLAMLRQRTNELKEARVTLKRLGVADPGINGNVVAQSSPSAPSDRMNAQSAAAAALASVG